MITTRFRTDPVPAICTKIRFLQNSHKSLNNISASIRIESGFFTNKSELQNDNKYRNQIEKICNRHRDSDSRRMSSPIESRESPAPRPINRYGNMACGAASAIVSRFRIAYRPCLKRIARVGNRSELRRRPRPTLIAIVSDATDFDGPDALARRVFARRRPPIQQSNRRSMTDAIRQLAAPDS
jgi:hypothetical protein